ncbi:MAG: lytic transglycosylase domain-containing protein [Betaproteobacteria bacterium]|jgi:soluble lytic murein transglycosylase|nr:lytic transglycosylase domain-containing protein [Betaproteobacteria bacterium]
MFGFPALYLLRLSVCTLALALTCAATTPAFAAKGDDAAIRAAADAFRRGQAKKLDRLAAQVAGHPLAPYVQYWQLKLHLEDADTATVREMLARNDGLLLGEQLRNDWLRVLGKRSQWDEFLAEYPRLAADDPDVTCLALQGRWRRGDEAALVEARGFWNAPRDIPDACMLLIETQIADGKITTSDVWDRVRVLLADGQLSAAKRTINYLPAAETPRERTIEAIARHPERYVKQTKFDPRKRMNRELMIFAVTRVARKDAELAESYFTPRLQEQFPTDDREHVWGQIASHAARQHLPTATLWFSRAGDAPLTDEQLAWRARAALREENWPEVAAAIDRMSADGRDDPTWIYWKGRALRAAGDRNDAELLYLRIAHLHEFYGKLAREELGVPLAIPPRIHVPTNGEVATAAQNPSLQRALALFRAELRTPAVREWNWGVRGMSDRELLAAAELARRYEIWDRAISTANRTVGTHDFSVRFLAPYRDMFIEQARAQGLEENWVLGLVRQESRFISDARSSAGASGLMQLMPRTARWVARQIGMRNYSWRRVMDVDVNIALGTGYLKYVYDELGGSSVLAATAYNAGPRRAQRWRGDRALEGAIYAETIPFSETRNYVKKVMSNTVYYAAIYGGRVESLKQRLGVIPPRDPDDKTGAGGEPTLK